MARSLKPGAPVSARKSKRKIKRDDAWEGMDEEKERMLRVVDEAALEVLGSQLRSGEDYVGAVLSAVQVYTLVRIAVEAAAAKAAGYESWADFESDYAERIMRP
jgi:hypothetical protein